MEETITGLYNFVKNPSLSGGTTSLLAILNVTLNTTLENTAIKEENKFQNMQNTNDELVHQWTAPDFDE